ncbi:MAG: DUF2092 domain-containing protein [Planctomycetota bacterium]
MHVRTSGTNLSCSILLGLVLGIASLGCGKPGDRADKAKADQPALSQSGAEIWQETLAAYRAAESYRDEAVLYLSYRLQGQLIQEPQPWSVSWSRGPEQKFSAKLFNAQLRSDGQRLSCYVYDIESANLDNQWLLLEQSGPLPLETLLADNLARYFIGGFSEIPLDESPELNLRSMTPPTIGWLSGQLQWDWLGEPRLVERLKDSLVDGRPCHHLKVHGERLSSEVWIDQDSRLVRQMTLPIELLDPAVRSAVELSEVQFFARMHKAERNLSLPLSEFQIEQPRDATPVHQFVALPEPFPCNGIGQPLPNLRLADAAGKFVDLTGERQPIVLVWISGVLGQDALAELRAAMDRLKDTPARWIAVFGDDQAEVSPGGGRQLYAELRQWISQNGLACEWLYDAQFSGSQALKLETLPAAVVVGPDGKVEYAVGLQTDRWTERLEGAVRRVQRGDSVAAEMLGDYQAYLTRYKRRLQLVSAQKLLGPSTVPRAGGENSPNAPSRSWRVSVFSKELQRPGNLALCQFDNQQQLLAFDGWQTLVRLDSEGKVLERIPLPLPAGVAVTNLRQGRDSTGQPLTAVWSLLGKELYLLDAAWKLRERVSFADNSTPDSILDCQLALNAEGKSVVWVAFQNAGLRVYDLEQKRWTSAFDRAVDSLAIALPNWWGVSGDQLWRGSPELAAQPVQLSSNLISYVHTNQAEPGSCFVAGVSGDGIWELTRLDPQGAEKSHGLIGPQLFELPLDPGALLDLKGERQVVAWADSLNRVHLFDQNLQPLGTWTAPGLIEGLALLPEADGWVLLVSLANEIRAIRQ